MWHTGSARMDVVNICSENVAQSDGEDVVNLCSDDEQQGGNKFVSKENLLLTFRKPCNIKKKLLSYP